MISFIGFPWTKIQRVHSYHSCQNFHSSWICCMVISWGEQGWILWLDKLKQYWFLLERCLTDILPHYLLFPSINALLRSNTPNGKIHRIFQRSSSTKVCVWDNKKVKLGRESNSIRKIMQRSKTSFWTLWVGLVFVFVFVNIYL